MLPVPDGPRLQLESESHKTPFGAILATINSVHQKAGGNTVGQDWGSDFDHELDFGLDTVITALDGTITLAGESGESLVQALGDLHFPSPADGYAAIEEEDNSDIYHHQKRRNGNTDSDKGGKRDCWDGTHDLWHSNDSDGVPQAEEGQGHWARNQRREDEKRSAREYKMVFGGTGTGPNDRDAAVEGTAYLGYRLLSDRKYDVEGCVDLCDQAHGCVFVNLYYEFNNDLVLPAGTRTTLKCALYGDIHTAEEKTNRGNQQLLPRPAGLTYIQESSGWASTHEFQQPIPEGYELIFGPINSANDASGYMGFALLDKYDVKACAEICNARAPHPFRGACKFFNIWRALKDGVPVSYTCALYAGSTDESTATYPGNNTISVSSSRGYRRITYVLDGGFEDYNPTCPHFCYSTSYSNWIGTSPQGGHEDASIFYFRTYAYVGHGVGLLGDAGGSDQLPGTLTYAHPIHTKPGRRYTIGFFHDSTYSGRNYERDAFVEVWWNREVVGRIQEGYSPWKYWEFEVVAAGEDELAFHGGKAPAWSFVDEVNVFLI
ncbi:hypothetical protein AX16_010019 [Volvariella volvacea WC 439]|nr:hypothetical protein AX16_010019 [Volvariella volvacea WC 439]